MLDYTATGVQSAQLLLAETAKRIAEYIREHPTPPKDFNKEPRRVAPVVGDTATQSSQSLGRYNGVDTGKDGASGTGGNSSDSSNVIPFRKTAPPPTDTQDASHPVVLPEAIAKQVTTANNVIQFFNSKLDSLNRQSSFSQTGQKAADLTTGLLADRQA